MNRQSRRGGTKQPPKEPTYVLKRSDLEKIKEKARLEAIDTIIVMVLALPIKVLHERYGWGMRKRLPEFAEAITDEYQAFSDGEMTLEQYQQYVFDYCGLEFKKNG